MDNPCNTPHACGYLNEGVYIELFVDRGHYKGDEIVYVNDERWIIPRGELVFVPRYVALKLEEQNKTYTNGRKAATKTSQGAYGGPQAGQERWKGGVTDGRSSIPEVV